MRTTSEICLQPADAGGGAAQVTAIYPSGEVLPENVLRFYLHFSVPMAPGRVADVVRLRDEAGRSDALAFMSFKQELWSADRTRLTLLIDPGRIKRSIVSQRGIGPALIEGRSYSLTIDEGWSSADGSSTLPGFSTSFRVGSALRTRPCVDRWRWVPPEPGSKAPMVITLDRAFDRHLLLDAVEIVGENGVAIDGVASVGRCETSWSLTPTDPWPEYALRVRVADWLEDVAGNNFSEVLERDIEAGSLLAVLEPMSGAVRGWAS